MAEQETEEIRPTEVLGTTGLKQFSGFIDEEFLANLRGENAIKTYREMINNSPIIASALNAINWLVRQVEWRIEPSDESDAAKAESEDTETALEDMSHTFQDFISEALSMIWAGYAPFEIVYKLRRGPDQEDSGLRSRFSDGKFGWRKIEIRGQETLDRWVFDDEGGLDGFIQQNLYGEQASNGPVFIPMEKALLFRIDKFKGNPEGKSLLRPAVIPYWYAKRIQEFEAIGVERNLAGMPIMEVPANILSPNASAADKKLKLLLQQFITQVRMDERWGGLVPSETKPDGSPSGYKFKLMQSSGRKLVDTDVILKRHRDDMLRMFMAQFLTMGQDGVGSLALSNDMTSMFGMAINTVMDSITDVVNRFMIPRRQRLNGVSPELDPTLEHGEIKGPDLEKVAKYMQALSTAGLVTPHPPLERKLMEIGKLPPPPEEEELIENPLTESTIDSVSRGGLNAESVKVILEVNKAVKNKQLDRETALATIAAALGIEESDAEKFVKAESNEPVPPQFLPGVAPVVTPPVPPDGGEGEEEGEEKDDDDE